jgi:hypothetical protein
VKTRLAWAFPLILAFSLVAGCGGSGGDGQTYGSDRDAVVAVADQHAEAVADQDGEAMCRVLSPRILDAYHRAGEDCATTWERNLESVSEQDAAAAEASRSRLTVDDVTIQGNRATLSPQVSLGVGLVKIDGRWLVDFSG